MFWVDGGQDQGQGEGQIQEQVGYWVRCGGLYQYYYKSCSVYYVKHSDQVYYSYLLTDPATENLKL